jgi:cytochrome c-type biogenesis protein CcmF
MISIVGTLALIVGFILACAGIVALIYGRRHADHRWLMWGRRASFGVVGTVTLAVILLEIALIRTDFAVRYVANNISISTPLPFRVIGLWGALEGSILFWQWLQAIFLGIVTFVYRRRYPELMPYVIAVLLGISGFFLLLMMGPANPFARLPQAPLDGRGLNPLLQNHPLMAVHPPLLYLGYVGFSVPYAFAMATLLAGGFHYEWMGITRRWTLLAWTFLTAGIFLGARWSYDVLGWGGYWAWDPVENASFMPWLVGTAFVHSTMVQQRTSLLRIWNLALIIAAFLLTIFGTFLTRSGVVASVHAFTQSLIGPLFLTFLVAALAFSVGALLRRLPSIRDAGTFEAYLSRESLMLLNNVILLTMAFTVLLGTVFPLFVAALTGDVITVGPPFFNRLFVPLGLLLIVLMVLGTLARWGRSQSDDLRHLWWVLLATGLVTVGLAVGGIRDWLPLTALSIVSFMALAQLSEFYRGTVATQAAMAIGPFGAFIRLFSANRQRYCGYLTHLGLAVAIVWIISSLAYRMEAEGRLAVGQSLQVGTYSLRYDRLDLARRPDKLVVAAQVSVSAAPNRVLAASRSRADGADVLAPSENFYPQSRTPIATPSVRTSWRDDLYVVLMDFDPTGDSVFLKAIVSPLIGWIWTGGFLMVAASVINLWQRSHQK